MGSASMRKIGRANAFLDAEMAFQALPGTILTPHHEPALRPPCRPLPNGGIGILTSEETNVLNDATRSGEYGRKYA